MVKNWGNLRSDQRRFGELLLLLNAVYLPAMSITSFFDRYLLLPIGSLLLMLAASFPHGGRSKVWKWLPLVAISLFSILATHDYLAWNRARHLAFQYLTQKGVGIKEMDAGYEYNGFYNYHQHREEVPGRSFWWVDADDWLISFGNVPGYDVERAFAYRRWLVLRNDSILVLKKE